MTTIVRRPGWKLQPRTATDDDWSSLCAAWEYNKKDLPDHLCSLPQFDTGLVIPSVKGTVFPKTD
jgi:hypothetical protein